MTTSGKSDAGQAAPGPGSSKQIERFIRATIADILEVDGASINADAHLVEDLGMDSMMALEILAAIEKRYRTKVPEDALPKMTTLNEIVRVTREHVRQ